MNSRVELTETEHFGTRMAALRSDLKDLKSRQSIPRELSAQAVYSENIGTWDITGLTGPTGSVRVVTVTWVSDGSGTQPFARLRTVVSNGSSEINHYERVETGFSYVVVRTSSLGQQTQTWTVTLAAQSSAASWSIKCGVLASLPGTVNVAVSV